MHAGYQPQSFYAGGGGFSGYDNSAMMAGMPNSWNKGGFAQVVTSNTARDFFGATPNGWGQPAASQVQAPPHSVKPEIPEVEGMVGDYLVTPKVLGTGAFAVVQAAFHRGTGTPVAVKIVDRKKLDAEALRQLRIEVGVLSKMNHQNIVKLFDCIDTQFHTYLFMELLSGGDLFDDCNCVSIPEWKARKYIGELCLGLDYLHKRGIAHLDIKPENLILDGTNTLKLCDEGACQVQHRDTYELQMLSGTVDYLAPEVFQTCVLKTRPGYNGFKADMWSLGVTLHTMLTGDLPFKETGRRGHVVLANKGKIDKDLLLQIMAGRYEPPRSVSPEARHLLSHLLVVDPTRRYSIDQVFAHQWLQGSDGLNYQELRPSVDPKTVIKSVTEVDPTLTDNRIRRLVVEDKAFDRRSPASSMESSVGPESPAQTARAEAANANAASSPGLPPSSSAASNSSPAAANSPTKTQKSPDKSPSPHVSASVIHHEAGSVRASELRALTAGPSRAPQSSELDVYGLTGATLNDESSSVSSQQQWASDAAPATTLTRQEVDTPPGSVKKDPACTTTSPHLHKRPEHCKRRGRDVHVIGQDARSPLRGSTGATGVASSISFSARTPRISSPVGGRRPATVSSSLPKTVTKADLPSSEMPPPPYSAASSASTVLAGTQQRSSTPQQTQPELRRLSHVAASRRPTEASRVQPSTYTSGTVPRATGNSPVRPRGVSDRSPMRRQSSPRPTDQATRIIPARTVTSRPATARSVSGTGPTVLSHGASALGSSSSTTEHRYSPSRPARGFETVVRSSSPSQQAVEAQRRKVGGTYSTSSPGTGSSTLDRRVSGPQWATRRPEATGGAPAARRLIGSATSRTESSTTVPVSKFASGYGLDDVDEFIRSSSLVKSTSTASRIPATARRSSNIASNDGYGSARTPSGMTVDRRPITIASTVTREIVTREPSDDMIVGSGASTARVTHGSYTSRLTPSSFQRSLGM